MEAELRRATVLFAVFVFSCILRFAYQLAGNYSLLHETIQSTATRLYIEVSLPLIWDITSILAILVLHYKSFKGTE